MMRNFNVAALAAAIMAAPAAAWAADAGHGQEIYQQCAACHGDTGAGTESGPSLIGVVGRKAGTADGFRYSPPMKRSGVVWDTTSLKEFIMDPQAKVKGTRMPFDGIKDQKEVEDLIAYIGTMK